MNGDETRTYPMMLRLCGTLILACGLWIGAGADTANAQGAAISLGAPQADPDAPLEVTADGLSVDRETGNAVFTGNVRAVQGTMTLNAERVEVLYDEEDAQGTDDDGIREIIATGNVILVNGPDVAESDRAVFRPREDRVVMTGNVLLTQGRTIVSGDRLVVNLATGQGNVEGRVKTVLRPRGAASE
ncbi:MAG: lipopolysaccharide export system protein LptA [Polaromonas sp.]|jgi:lipopolysaccharide export system protein LptA